MAVTKEWKRRRRWRWEEKIVWQWREKKANFNQNQQFQLRPQRDAVFNLDFQFGSDGITISY